MSPHPQPQPYGALSHFQVRINAAYALSVPIARGKLGPSEFLGSIVATLVDSLDNIDSMEDFAEFQYQATLREQLSMTLFHILHIADATSEADCHAVATAIQGREPTVRTALKLVLEAQGEPPGAQPAERPVHRYACFLHTTGFS